MYGHQQKNSCSFANGPWSPTTESPAVAGRSKVARRSVGKPYLRSEGFQQVHYSQSKRVHLAPDTTVHVDPTTWLDHHGASGEVFAGTPAVTCRPLSAFKGISRMYSAGFDARSAPIQPAGAFHRIWLTCNACMHSSGTSTAQLSQCTIFLPANRITAVDASSVPQVQCSTAVELMLS